MASRVFQNEHYARKLLNRCHSAWEEDRYLDVNLCVGDRKIAVHRLVLCGLSDYFKKLFEIDGQDSSDIVMKDVDFDCLYFLVQYAYTGSIEINQTNVLGLLHSANYFQVTAVKSVCEKFFMEQISTDSCINLIILADKHDLDSLSNTCIRFLGEEFEKICTKDKFLELPMNVLIELLRSNDLVVLRHKMPLLHGNLELSLFRGVLRYISLSQFRSQNMVELLKSIRFPFIPKDEVTSELKKWPNLEEHNFIQDILNMYEKGNMSKMPALWLIPRKCPIELKKDTNFCANDGSVLTDEEGRLLSKFEDSCVAVDAGITQIKLWIRHWGNIPVLSCIGIKYSNGVSFKHGERFEKNIHLSKHVIELGEGEYITQIEGRHGTMIDQICFKTEYGREFGPYGGVGGRPFICKPTRLGGTAYLHAFSGDVVHTRGYKDVINLGFIWKYYKKHKNKHPKSSEWKT